MTLTYGSLCAGMGGLEMGVQSVLGGETRWMSEFDPHPSRILAHHQPHVPNLGDMTRIDWATVEPVDVLTGGTPCQDLSHAGKRAGMTDGTRSNLWVQMREAIHVIRPRLVVWENVRGAYSAAADSDLEWCAGCMGVRRPEPSLRALGRVLGDLADLGYDAWWYGIRAADVGACHGRFRVFVWAVPADSDLSGLQGHADQARAAQAGRHGHPEPSAGGPALTLLPTTSVSEANGVGQHGTGGDDLRTTVSLLPTPRATDGTKGGPNQRGSSGDLMLPSAAAKLLPTPTAMDYKASGGGTPSDVTLTDALVRGRTGLLPTPTTTQRGADANLDTREGAGVNLHNAVATQDWAQYEAAIRRHERVLGRPAPAPTETGPKGGARLSPRFVEFMMMLPDGHVTDPAIWDGMTDKRGKVLTGDRLTSAARNAQLKALGNGVVPLQAAATGRMWLRDMRLAVA